jgi:hypothetical protein
MYLESKQKVLPEIMAGIHVGFLSRFLPPCRLARLLDTRKAQLQIGGKFRGGFKGYAARAIHKANEARLRYIGIFGNPVLSQSAINDCLT